MNLYVGTSGYSYPQWKGTFYPPDLPSKQMLHYYGEHFRAVEINNTFYRMPKAAALQAWASEVSADFRFVLKAPQRITHTLRLREVDESVAYLFDVADVLGERLGPVLFQLPPNFRKDAARLRDFLSLLPPRHRAALEFRHASWFDDEIFDLLRGRDAALCVAEAENELDVPLVATASWGYLRLRRLDYGAADVARWAERVARQPWQDAFVFFKHEEEGKGPQLAEAFAHSFPVGVA